MSTPRNNGAAHAVQLAELGYHVHPVAPKGTDFSQRDGAKEGDASTDPAKVRAMCDRYPDATLPAVRCGRNFGLLVIDIDGPEGAATFAELENRNGPLGPPTVLSGSGGQHFYRRAPADLGTTSTGFVKLVPGIDVFGTHKGGRFVVGPGGDRRAHKETHTDPYRWGPAGRVAHADLEPLPPMWLSWLTDAIKDRGTGEGGTNGPIRPGDPRLGDIGQGVQNDTLYRAGLWLRLNGAPDAQVRACVTALGKDACNPPHPPERVESIVKSLLVNVKPKRDTLAKATDADLDSLAKGERIKRPPTRHAFKAALAEAQMSLRYNERLEDVEWRRSADDAWGVPDEAAAAAIIDDLADRTRSATHEGFSVGTGAKWNHLVLSTGDGKRYEPFRAYLDTLPPWDPDEEEPLIAKALSKCFNFPDADPRLIEWTSRFLWVAAVERTLRPGCPAPVLPILCSALQEAGKSSVLEAMPPDEDLFSDSFSLDVRDTKEALERIADAVIAEWQDMPTGYRGGKLEEIKAFITSKVDTYRMSYGRRSGRHPRRSIIVATSNNTRPVPSDPSGARRFVALTVTRKTMPKETPTPAAWVRAHRDRLWAEAVHAVTKGETCMDGYDSIRTARTLNLADHRDADHELEEALSAFLYPNATDDKEGKPREGFTAQEARDAVKETVTGLTDKRLHRALRSCGFTPAKNPTWGEHEVRVRQGGETVTRKERVKARRWHRANMLDAVAA